MRNSETNSSNPEKWIPLSQVYLSRAVNVAGYAFRQYQTDTTWDIHLHPGGGLLALTNKQMGQTFYVPTAIMESCDGISDGRVSSSLPANVAQLGGPLPQTRDNGLVPNQVRREVIAEPLRSVNAAEELEPAVSKEQRAAKDAHFADKEDAELAANSPRRSSSDNGAKPGTFKSLAVPAPAKRRPGRPRKVIQDPPADTVSASSTDN